MTVRKSGSLRDRALPLQVHRHRLLDPAIRIITRPRPYVISTMTPSRHLDPLFYYIPVVLGHRYSRAL